MFASRSCDSELSDAVVVVSIVDAFADDLDRLGQAADPQRERHAERPADADVEIALRARREARQFGLHLVRARD